VSVCVCVCVYMHIYVYIHPSIHTYINICMYLNEYVCMSVYLYVVSMTLRRRSRHGSGRLSALVLLSYYRCASQAARRRSCRRCRSAAAQARRSYCMLSPKSRCSPRYSSLWAPCISRKRKPLPRPAGSQVMQVKGSVKALLRRY
jgi:hypothetical protein